MCGGVAVGYQGDTVCPEEMVGKGDEKWLQIWYRKRRRKNLRAHAVARISHSASQHYEQWHRVFVLVLNYYIV